MEDTLSITLRFGTWTLPMTVKREEEYIYRQAEKLIKERYSFYTSSYPGQSKEMYLVMTILEIPESVYDNLLSEVEAAIADDKVKR